MDRFTGMLNAVDCHAESMMLQFNSNDSFNSARHSWNWVSDAVNNTFVLIANYDGCGPDQERQPFLVNDLRFVEANFTVFLEAQQKEWEDVAKTYSFNMGYRPPLNSSVLAPRDDPDFVMSLASNFNRNLFSTTIDGIDLSVDCVNCGTSGKLNVDFDLDVNVFSDSHLAMKVSPQDVAAFLQLRLSASGTLAKEYRWEKNLISIPIEGVKVGSFAKIGAFLDVDVGFTMDEWTGEVDAQFGARMGLSNNAIVEIDVLHLGSGKFSGWDPALTAIPFTLSAKVEGGVTIYAQPAISLSAEAFGKGIELSLDLQMPYIDADFTAMADTGGVCDTQQTLGVEVSASAGVDLSVQVATAGNEANPLWEQELLDKSWPLFDKCFAFGPKNAQSGAPPMPKPPKKTKTKAKASKTKSSPKEIPTSAPAKTLKPNPTKVKSDDSSFHTPTKTNTDDGTPTPKPKPSSSGSKVSSEPSNSSGASKSSSAATQKNTVSNSNSKPTDGPTASSGATKSSTNTESGTASKSSSQGTKEPTSSSGVANPGSTASKSGSKSSVATESGPSKTSGIASGSSTSSSTSGTKSNTNEDTSSTKTGTNTKASISFSSDSSVIATGSGTSSKPGTSNSISTGSKTGGSSSSSGIPTETGTASKSGTLSSIPTNSKTGSLTITTSSSASSVAACHLPKRAVNPEDFYCDENGHTHTTITTSVTSSLTTPKVTCSAKWTQACYHYRSVMSVNSDNPDMVRFTCGATSSSAPGKATKVWSTTVSRNNVVTTPKGNQHHWQWIEGWVAAGEGVCQRDEWPPRSFWPTKKRNQLGQMVRFLPGPENGGAGSMFNSFCERNGERGTDGKKNAKLHTTLASLESVGVTSGVTSMLPLSYGFWGTKTDIEKRRLRLCRFRFRNRSLRSRSGMVFHRTLGIRMD
jgi:hypothetical protein